MIEKIIVKAHREYTVNIGSGLLSSCGEIVKSVVSPMSAAIITDSNVAPLYLDTVKKSLQASGFKTCSFVFPAGEASKNISTLSDILEFLAESGITHGDILVALGGGVTGDITGLASALYLRGTPYVQIPTTLLAAVDSSVGGKTAIDLKAGKNLAGVFNQPISVICDVDTLNTLSPEIFSDGCAECIKYGVLGDQAILDISRNGKIKDNVIEVIKHCVKMKAEFVEKDEFDNNERKFLNLGHTIGHAIEKCTNFEISHGSAVAIGMVMITRAGEKMGLTKAESLNSLKEILEINGLPTSTLIEASDLATVALSDKKRNGENITLIIPKALGECIQKTIPVTELANIINLGGNEQ